MMDKANQLVGNYLDNLAKGTKALPLPMALRPMLHVGDGHLDSRSPLEPARQLLHRRGPPCRRGQATGLRPTGTGPEGRGETGGQRAQTGARGPAGRLEHAEGAPRPGGATPVGRDALARRHGARRDGATARRRLAGEPRAGVPRGLDDPGALAHLRLRAAPARDRPGVPECEQAAGGGHPVHGENPAGDRKVLVAYQLTGQQARDISVFSSFTEDQEAVFPPRSRTHRVDDPEFAARLRRRRTGWPRTWSPAASFPRRRRPMKSS